MYPEWQHHHVFVIIGINNRSVQFLAKACSVVLQVLVYCYCTGVDEYQDLGKTEKYFRKALVMALLHVMSVTGDIHQDIDRWVS